jgi:hypothetical protein
LQAAADACVPSMPSGSLIWLVAVQLVTRPADFGSEPGAKSSAGSRSWLGFAPAAALAFVGIFFVLTLRPGQDWTLGDDFAQYILHARNIAEGRAYASTGYIYNPDLAVVGPPAYPPVLPLALAPVWALFGLNLQAMKVLMVVFFVSGLGLASELMRPALGPLERAAIVLIVGLNPYFWDFKDAILSDLPFMFFAFAALMVARQTHQRYSRAPLPLAACLGGAMYLAYGTRVAGLALVLTVIAFDLVTLRRLRRATLVASGVFAVLAGAQQLWIPGVDAYLQQLAFDPAGLAPLLLGNARALGAGFGSLWTAGPSTPLGLVALLAAGTLLARGYLLQLRHRGLSIVEVFPPAYLAIILAWPHGQELRFLIPVVPFAVYYGWLGLRSLPIPHRLRIRMLRRPLFGALVGAVLLAYAARYASFDYGPLRSGVAAPDTQALFAFVRDQTSPADVIVFRRARALALFTGRAAGPYAPGPRRRDAWTYLRDVGARYVVSAPQDSAFWSSLAAQSPELIAPVYGNASYIAYQIHLPLPAALPPPGPIPDEKEDL